MFAFLCAHKLFIFVYLRELNMYTKKQELCSHYFTLPLSFCRISSPMNIVREEGTYLRE